MELTGAIREYVEMKTAAFEKYVKSGDESVLCEVEVGKTTNHHRQGDFFKAEIRLHLAGKDFYAVSEKEDLYAAIDEVKDVVSEALASHKDKKTTLFRKGAHKIKNLLRGAGFSE